MSLDAIFIDIFSRLPVATLCAAVALLSPVSFSAIGIDGEPPTPQVRWTNRRVCVPGGLGLIRLSFGVLGRVILITGWMPGIAWASRASGMSCLTCDLAFR